MRGLEEEVRLNQPGVPQRRSVWRAKEGHHMAWVKWIVWNAFEIWPLGHLKVYVCRSCGRVDDLAGGRAGERARGREGGRIGRLGERAASGRDGGAIWKNVLI